MSAESPWDEMTGTTEDAALFGADVMREHAEVIAPRACHTCKLPYDPRAGKTCGCWAASYAIYLASIHQEPECPKPPSL